MTGTAVVHVNWRLRLGPVLCLVLSLLLGRPIPSRALSVTIGSPINVQQKSQVFRLINTSQFPGLPNVPSFIDVSSAPVVYLSDSGLQAEPFLHANAQQGVSSSSTLTTTITYTMQTAGGKAVFTDVVTNTVVAGATPPQSNEQVLTLTLNGQVLYSQDSGVVKGGLIDAIDPPLLYYQLDASDLGAFTLTATDATGTTVQNGQVLGLSIQNLLYANNAVTANIVGVPTGAYAPPASTQWLLDVLPPGQQPAGVSVLRHRVEREPAVHHDSKLHVCPGRHRSRQLRGLQCHLPRQLDRLPESHDRGALQQRPRVRVRPVHGHQLQSAETRESVRVRAAAIWSPDRPPATPSMASLASSSIGTRTSPCRSQACPSR